MSDYKPINIRQKRQPNTKVIKMILFRIVPIVLAVVISICSFSIFEKKISEIIAMQKYSSLAPRGNIDDPNGTDYSSVSIDWMQQYSTLDPNGFDPLALSPLGLVDSLRPSDSLTPTAFEIAMGYTNKQSKIWSIYESVNSDVCAWIYMPGLGINYPVALEDKNNPDYYLTHSYDKTKSTSGMIFISSACDINPMSRNLVIHGHNMRDGSMFANLKNYLDGTKNYYDSHKYIFLDTLYGTYRYEIYSVYKTKPEDIYLHTDFASNATFLSWCEETNNRGLFKNSATSFSASDRTLTLSTCDNTGKYRIIVHAKMVYPIGTDDIDSKYVPVDDTQTNTNVTPTPASPENPTPTPSTGSEYVVGEAYRVNLNDHKSTLRLRGGPGTNYSTVGSLAHGTQLTLLSIEGDWVKIKSIGGMEGYIMKKYIVSEASFSYTPSNAVIGPPTSNIITPAP